LPAESAFFKIKLKRTLHDSCFSVNYAPAFV
jgi:hypothetical protein